MNVDKLKEEKDFWEYMVAKNGYRAQNYNEGQENFLYKEHYFTLYYPKFIDSFLQPSKDKVLYEMGCGWGKQSLLFSKMFKTVIASDVSKSMLNIAKDLCSECTNIVYCEFPENLSIVKEPFDCLFSYGVMQSCSDEVVIGCLKQVVPLLKIDGKFLIEFNMFDASTKEQKQQRAGFANIMRNPFEAKDLLETCGLKVEGYRLVLQPCLQVWMYGKKEETNV